jgi:Acyl-CoA synthetase (NDP forming)
MGITNMDANLCGLMNFSIPKSGNVSVVSQSGTLGTISMLNASAKGVGFNKFVSSGNEADLRMEDFIEYFSQDEGTDVIFAFIEGVRGGRRFLDVSKEATRKKPFIVLKGGATSSGSRAARSHTGSMAGSDEIYDAIFRQSGIARASDESDMIDLIKGFSKSPLPKGRRVAIYTVGGGFGILAADECEKNGLDVIKLPEDIIEELNHFLPPFWSHGNPIDVTGSGAAAFGGDGSIDERALKILLESPAIDGIIFMAPTNITSRINRVMPRISGDIKEMLSTIIETGMLGGASKDQAEKIIELKERYDKPMVGVNPWGESEIEEYRILEEGGIPLYRSTTQAARVLSKLIEYKEYLDKQKFLSDTKV